MAATNGTTSNDDTNLVSLAERRVFSSSFRPLYDEGMQLVERAAEYLDGEGRTEAKRLSRVAATLYAAESMRLTTRHIQPVPSRHGVHCPQLSWR